MNTLPCIQGFIDYLTNERHFSAYTARCYGADLRQYVEFYAGNNPTVNESLEQQVYTDRVNKAQARTPGSAVVGQVGPACLSTSLLDASIEKIREFLTHLGEMNYSAATMARPAMTRCMATAKRIKTCVSATSLNTRSIACAPAPALWITCSNRRPT